MTTIEKILLLSEANGSDHARHVKLVTWTAFPDRNRRWAIEVDVTGIKYEGDTADEVLDKAIARMTQLLRAELDETVTTVAEIEARSKRLDAHLARLRGAGA